jgi:hypothetical protein
MSSELYFLNDQVIESLSRLLGFSSMKERSLDGDDDVEDDVDKVAELLVRRDLLTFSASARNFAEACDGVMEMRAISVPICELLQAPVRDPFYAEGLATITLYQALSRILHSNSLGVLRSEFDYELKAATSSEGLLGAIGRRRTEHKPLQTEPLIVITCEKDPVNGDSIAVSADSVLCIPKPRFGAIVERSQSFPPKRLSRALSK